MGRECVPLGVRLVWSDRVSFLLFSVAAGLLLLQFLLVGGGTHACDAVGVVLVDGLSRRIAEKEYGGP